MKALRTSDVAKSASVHPNTIRSYEALGLISPVPREKNGYRRYEALHADQARLIRMNLKCTYLGGKILDVAYDVLKTAAQKKLSEALEMQRLLVRLVENEKSQAEQAFRYLEDWAGGQESQDACLALQMKEAARMLDVTCDMLYNWERNGLINIPRNKGNGYRIYGSHEINRLRVIRMLRKARYSNMSILRAMRYLDSGKREDLKKIIDTPEPDDDILMLCFSDYWLTALDQSLSSARHGVAHLEAMVRRYPNLK